MFGGEKFKPSRFARCSSGGPFLFGPSDAGGLWWRRDKSIPVARFAQSKH